MQEVPDDIDGQPPADFPYNQPSSRFWRPPSFRGGPEYYPSPPRRDPRDRYSGYPPSGYQDTGYGRGPERGYPPAQEYDRRPLPHRREPEAGPRYDAGARFPPPPYEPEGRYTSPDRGPPPSLPTGPPAPRGPPPMEGTPVFPPMPYEPTESPASTGPLAEEPAALPQEPPAEEVFPPLPYEPEGIVLLAFPCYVVFCIEYR